MKGVGLDDGRDVHRDRGAGEEQGEVMAQAVVPAMQCQVGRSEEQHV